MIDLIKKTSYFVCCRFFSEFGFCFVPKICTRFCWQFLVGISFQVQDLCACSLLKCSIRKISLITNKGDNFVKINFTLIFKTFVICFPQCAHARQTRELHFCWHFCFVFWIIFLDNFGFSLLEHRRFEIFFDPQII